MAVDIYDGHVKTFRIRLIHPNFRHDWEMKTSLLLALVLLCVPTFSTQGLKAYKTFKNILRPFTSDGYSQFPDSIVGLDYEECCRQHDYAYWKGGTSVEKADADEALGICVGNNAFGALGSMMELAVAYGGVAALPTTWRWGYGWVINRGYAPLSEELSEYAESIFDSRDKNAGLVSPGILQNKDKITGDYCLDMVLDYVASELEMESLEYYLIGDKLSSSAEGFTREISILTPECSNPIKVDFLLLRPSACTDQMGELLSRGRIRMNKRGVKCENIGFSSIL